MRHRIFTLVRAVLKYIFLVVFVFLLTMPLFGRNAFYNMSAAQHYKMFFVCFSFSSFKLFICWAHNACILAKYLNDNFDAHNLWHYRCIFTCNNPVLTELWGDSHCVEQKLKNGTIDLQSICVSQQHQHTFDSS